MSTHHFCNGPRCPGLPTPPSPDAPHPATCLDLTPDEQHRLLASPADIIAEISPQVVDGQRGDTCVGVVVLAIYATESMDGGRVAISYTNDMRLTPRSVLEIAADACARQSQQARGGIPRGIALTAPRRH